MPRFAYPAWPSHVHKNRSKASGGIKTLPNGGGNNPVFNDLHAVHSPPALLTGDS
jgi:hypothetical protein